MGILNKHPKIPDFLLYRYRKPQQYRQQNGETVTVFSREDKLYAIGFGFQDIIDQHDLIDIIKGIYIK